MAPTIDIAICDDHALVRSGLHHVVTADPALVVVGEAANTGEAPELVRAGRPDVLLPDVTMPGRSGVDVLPEILAASPDTKVLMLSMHDDPVYVRRSFAAGAAGFLLKDAADADLLTAIRAVQEGHRYVHPVLGA